MGSVTVYYLEATAPEQLRPKRDPGGLEVAESEVRQYTFNRFLYQLVGTPWQWTDKSGWSDQQWQDYVESDSLRTWVAWYRGAPAGYFELARNDLNEVQIAYFGLADPFIGYGRGGYLLTLAIEAAWAWQATRVWVHTCTLDHPAALANYQARGMRIYRTDLLSEASNS